MKQRDDEEETVLAKRLYDNRADGVTNWNLVAS